MEQIPAPQKYNRFGSWITLTSSTMNGEVLHHQLHCGPALSMFVADLAAVGSMLPWRNASKEEGNTCSQDTRIFL